VQFQEYYADPRLFPEWPVEDQGEPEVAGKTKKEIETPI